MSAFKACPNVFFGFRSFYHKTQLVIIVAFSLPCNWAFWSAALFFALRAMSQITYQQLIHVSCGIVRIKSSHKKSIQKQFQPSLYNNYVAASRLLRRASARRDDALASFMFFALATSLNAPEAAVAMRFFA